MVSNQDSSIVYFDKSPVLFSGPGTAGNPVKKRPSQTEEADSLPIAEWGTGNDFPKIARAAKESNPDLVSALDWKARALYSGGIKYQILDRYTELPVEFTTPELRKMKYEIDQFVFRNRHYTLQAAVDFYDLYNVFPEVIIDERREKVIRISAPEAANCRFERREPNGDIPNVFIHPDWDEWTGNEDDEYLIKVPCVDPKNVSPQEIKENRSSSFKFIFPVNYPTGKNYYQLPHWWSLKVSKWLDFGNMIPTVKETILKNIALIRYHIQMPDYWMQERYSNWSQMNDAQKKKAVEKEFGIINEVLTKPENTGKSVFTTFKTKIANGQEYGGWKIEAVDDKMKDGALLADSSEATIKVFSATSIDPALHGLIPGKGGSNRNGSDKREALNIYLTGISAHENCLLDPWNWSAWFSGWTNENYITRFYFEKPYMQTLNQVTPSKRDTTLPSNADQ